MKIKLKQIVVAVVAMVATSLFAEFDWEEAADKGLINMVNLSPSTPVGTVLQDNTCYFVNQNVTLDASEMAGQSALKVPAGASVWILLMNKSVTLTVKGGHGSGQVPGGAGIEVPNGAKLVICGEGTLDATGGNAANGGDGTMAMLAQRVYDEPFALTSNAFTRIGYDFLGWTDTNGVHYADGETVSNLTAAAGVTVALSAEWQPQSFTVTFIPGGGTVDPVNPGGTQDGHEGVQLWANGPYWATMNCGATKIGQAGSYYAGPGDTKGKSVSGGGLTGSLVANSGTTIWGNGWRKPTATDILSKAWPTSSTPRPMTRKAAKSCPQLLAMMPMR